MTSPDIDVETQVHQLRDRLATAQRAKIRAEAAAEAARATEADALTRLRVEYDVNDLNEARVLLAALQAELADEVTALRTALDESGT